MSSSGIWLRKPGCNQRNFIAKFFIIDTLLYLLESSDLESVPLRSAVQAELFGAGVMPTA